MFSLSHQLLRKAYSLFVRRPECEVAVLYFDYFHEENIYIHREHWNGLIDTLNDSEFQHCPFPKKTNSLIGYRWTPFLTKLDRMTKWLKLLELANGVSMVPNLLNSHPKAMFCAKNSQIHWPFVKLFKLTPIVELKEF